MSAQVSKASVLLLPALRQYMHNNGSGLLAGYDCAEVDRIVDELIARSEAAEAMVSARIEQIPIDAKMVMVATDLVMHPELREQFEEFSEAIKKRCTSGRWTLVAFFPESVDIQALDAEKMRETGLSRQLSEEFRPDQWWVAELETMAASGTNDQKRAAAVVRNLLKQIEERGLNPERGDA